MRELLGLVRRLLPERWYRALELYYAEGHTMDEVGLHLGVSRKRVHQLLTKAVQRVRSFLCPRPGARHQGVARPCLV